MVTLKTGVFTCVCLRDLWEQSLESFSQWWRGGEEVHAPRTALCRGQHLEGRKYGILKFGRFWLIGFCIAERIGREFTLCNYTSKLSILIGGAPTQTFALGGKPPQATTGFSASFPRTAVTFL